MTDAGKSLSWSLERTDAGKSLWWSLEMTDAGKSLEISDAGKMMLMHICLSLQ